MSEMEYRIISSYLNMGNSAEDSDDLKSKKRLFIPMASSGVFVGAAIGIFEAGLGLFPQAYLPFTLSLLFIINLVQLRIFKSLRFSHALGFLTLVIFPILNQWSLGGFAAAGAISIWGISAPFGALIFQTVKEALPQFFIFTAAVIAGLLLEMFFPAPWQRMPENISSWLLMFNFPGFIVFVFANVMHFVKQKDNAMEALDREHFFVQQERAKSERLLLNILPEKIADRLKADESYIADGFRNVSILFADIAGFTPLSAKLSPEKLVELLNEIFTEFDVLADRYRLEKIKTIGDAYMAAAGLPEPDPLHAESCVRMALEMKNYMQKSKFNQTENLSLRIGIHSGSAVAGVIGKKKFAYDLWGDAVNTASRMESHGVPGEIQISEEVKKLIGDQFILKERGTVEVKGKGIMKTYFVEGLSVRK